MSVGRLSELGSRINCVRVVWSGLSRILLLGKYCAIVLNRLGVRLLLVSVVALHAVNRCTMSSVEV